MDRASIKQKAQDVLSSQKKPILQASALFVALILVFSVLSFRLTGPSEEEMLRFTDAVMAQDYTAAQEILASVQPPLLETIMSDLLSCLQGVVAFGFFAMLLKASRGREVQRGMLLDGFGSLVPVLLLVLLTRLIVTLGFLLLILPGIWALYSYRMARYLMILHPEYRVTDCLRLSRLRMRGHRVELFLLDLSFLGWALLLVIPVVGLAVAVWALPYWNCSCALFFEEINAELESQSPDKNQNPVN